MDLPFRLSPYLQTNNIITFANPSTTKIIDWDTVIFDDFESFNPKTPSRITIPYNIDLASFSFILDSQPAPSAQNWLVLLLKNGNYLAQLLQLDVISGSAGAVFPSTAPLFSVKQSDYFEIKVIYSGTQAGALVGGTTNYTTCFKADFFTR